MIPSLRVAAIWTGVGVGHLAALGSLWGSSLPSGDPGNGIVLVVLLPAEAVTAKDAPLAALPARISVQAERRAEIAAQPECRPAAVESIPARSLPAALGTDDFSPPAFLLRLEPIYPRSARLAGVEGVVGLHLRLSAEGTLVHAEIATSSGSPALDAAALAAARGSAYIPARQGGHPVPSETEAAYRFRLR